MILICWVYVFVMAGAKRRFEAKSYHKTPRKYDTALIIYRVFM